VLMRVTVVLGLIVFVYCVELKLNLNSDQDVCRLFPDGAVLRKPGSCRDTIKCQDGKSFEHTVKCEVGQVISLDKMTCTRPSKDDKYCTPGGCDKKSKKWIEDAKNCEDWVACDNGTVTAFGSCPIGQIFVQEQQKCEYRPFDYKCDRVYDICNVAQIGQRIWDENNCHKYFVCDKKKLKSDTCPLGTYYDVRSGQCNKKSTVNCYKHPVPEEACGSRKVPIKDHFVMDKATCRGYFYCMKKTDENNVTIPDENPAWNQCPVGYFFDGKLEVCRNQNYVKCIEDRCDGKLYGWVLSEMPGCQHYLECSNNMTIKEAKCPGDTYFDPISETCVINKISYPICS
ncbi:hypothetical protein DOY81_007899, partial [Sarcophaga bullata]